jgi:transcriptional regulator with XRE-family HTH domain
VSEESPRLTVNQLVAYNLARARKERGWTQDETAAILTERTGKRWTSATLGAAERSWESGRTREFNASELMAFCVTFNQPLAFFFLPRESDDENSTYGFGAPGDADADFLGSLEMLLHLLAVNPGQGFFDALQPVLDKYHYTWTPARLEKAGKPQRAMFWELKRDLDRRMSAFEREFAEFLDKEERKGE